MFRLRFHADDAPSVMEKYPAKLLALPRGALVRGHGGAVWIRNNITE
jgi:hypothetical protein